MSMMVGKSDNLVVMQQAKGMYEKKAREGDDKNKGAKIIRLNNSPPNLCA